MTEPRRLRVRWVQEVAGRAAWELGERLAASGDLTEPELIRHMALEHVEAVTILNWFQGVYKNTRPENFFPRFATDAETLLDVFPEYRIPAEQVEAWKADRRGFISGKALAEQQGWELGDTITIKGDIYPVDVELVLRGAGRYLRATLPQPRSARCPMSAAPCCSLLPGRFSQDVARGRARRRASIGNVFMVDLRLGGSRSRAGCKRSAGALHLRSARTSSGYSAQRA